MDVLRARRRGALFPAAAASRVDGVFRRHPFLGLCPCSRRRLSAALVLSFAGIVFGCTVRPCAPRAIRVSLYHCIHACGAAYLHCCQQFIAAGLCRALLSTVLAFLLVDLLQAFALLPRSGSAAILPMLHLFARETALSCLLLVPVYPALRAVRRAFPD